MGAGGSVESLPDRVRLSEVREWAGSAWDEGKKSQFDALLRDRSDSEQGRDNSGNTATISRAQVERAYRQYLELMAAARRNPKECMDWGM